MAISGFLALFLTAASAAQCTNIQLGTQCDYKTTECTKGKIQWNYPAATCQWTFAPDGLSNFQLSAIWATASYVNLTFYDGENIASAKPIGFVSGGRQDQRSVNVSSSTGVVHVRLGGPPSMMTYALIFSYSITPNANVESCRAYDGRCRRCLTAGCTMVGGALCVPSDRVPTDTPAWSAAQSSPDEQCTIRRAFLEKANLCKSRSTDCRSCLDAGCSWNILAARGDECISGCGFFPCELQTRCPAPNPNALKVGGTLSASGALGDSATTALMSILVFGLIC